MMVVVENLTDTIKLEFKRFCLPGILVIINFIIKLLPLEKTSYKTESWYFKFKGKVHYLFEQFYLRENSTRV